MKYLDEYRNAEAAKQYLAAIAQITTRSWAIMEVCGGQTHSIVKYGISDLLPKAIRLIHGPGCPVCVTPVEMVNKAIAIARQPGVIFCSFGDMLRVPGSDCDLLSLKGEGADIRIVYSPLDAVNIAADNPQRQIVFFAVGFETTAPANALAIHQAATRDIHNFSALVSHVLVPPAIEAIMTSPDTQVQGFLAAGHVCTVMGLTQYIPLAEKYRVPIVVTGFEPVDVLQGIYMCVRQLEENRHEVENQYTRSATVGGNRHAQQLVNSVFQISERKWRGMGEIPASGLSLADDYATFDAERRFDVANVSTAESAECISGLVLQGIRTPLECPAFGATCTPEHPLGATMVSGEGACAAYYHYRRKAPSASLNNKEPHTP
ncbi:hydrogenase formation protein HypD [Nitrosomonas mobilis]|uniref:Hydrogenase maturation factor n=1 Tax=Nitrosomonas mobilis TaxID=51642 RepID=A0A1G5SDT8_9PROT|nr:hydrogenase formation protein HypD [Nitrosomonas mobilis]SCZ85364.1 protein required for maturation of hydrogenases [Nitrosomonas mobilis]